MLNVTIIDRTVPVVPTKPEFYQLKDKTLYRLKHYTNKEVFYGFIVGETLVITWSLDGMKGVSYLNKEEYTRYYPVVEVVSGSITLEFN